MLFLLYFIWCNISVTMSRHREWDPACKVYIGNLHGNASKNELEDTFSKYGPLRNVWVARNPPGFAFIEFDDPRDAEDAVRGLDGTYVRFTSPSHLPYNFVCNLSSWFSSRCCGSRIVVEMSSGKSRRRSRDYHPSRRSPYSNRRSPFGGRRSPFGNRRSPSYR